MHPEFDEAIVDAGAVPPLVELVRDGAPDAQEGRARALLNLAEFSDGHRSAIAHAGGIPPLTVLARDGTAGAREDAAQPVPVRKAKFAEIEKFERKKNGARAGARHVSWESGQLAAHTRVGRSVGKADLPSAALFMNARRCQSPCS